MTHLCVHVCTHSCVCVYLCVHRPEFNLGCHSKELTLLCFFERKSLTDTEGCLDYARQVG